MEELRDVYNHFLLYYGADIPKMHTLEKQKRREESGAADGEHVDVEDNHENQMKHASRKSGYTICVKNKIGNHSLEVLSDIRSAHAFSHIAHLESSVARMAIQGFLYKKSKGPFYSFSEKLYHKNRQKGIKG